MQPADIDPSDLLGQLETLERDRCKYVGPSGPYPYSIKGEKSLTHTRMDIWGCPSIF